MPTKVSVPSKPLASVATPVAKFTVKLPVTATGPVASMVCARFNTSSLLAVIVSLPGPL
ncbi:hypothetical protein LTEGF4_12730 [Limnohabitans sp. TEGF004]|nr:hypothetical protein LTEGF4_12710 [Limnohabitans sp. TEGF004]BDU55592.1 hypothetical protein LTEGF4_12730 [Limnohabitans sp. TEGF004]